MPYTDFTQMPVWNISMEIGEEIFSLSEALPRKEDYALISQIRRSALSISANIAEGFEEEIATRLIFINMHWVLRWKPKII